jgi:hypothetical protein
MDIVVPSAVSFQIVRVLLHFVGKVAVVRLCGGDQPVLPVFLPGVEVVVSEVLLRRRRGGALRSDRPLARPDQDRTPLGGHRRDARIHDELHGAAIFEEVRPILALALRRERASGRFHHDFGVALGPHDQAPRPEAEPVGAVPFHVVQLRSLIHPGRDPAREAQFDLSGFPRPNPVSGKERASPFRLVGSEVVRALVPDIAVDETEVAVRVGTPGLFVGLGQHR